MAGASKHWSLNQMASLKSPKVTRWLEVGIGLVEVLKLVGIMVVICMAVGER